MYMPQVPFARPSFPGFSVPLQLPPGQPHPAGHGFQGRPFMDLPRETLPPQISDADKHQASPARGALAAQTTKEFSPKTRLPASRSSEAPQEPMKPHDVRTPYSAPSGSSLTNPTAPTTRHSISMAGDSMMMVAQHFQMSGM